MERVQSECSYSATCHIRAQRGDNTHCSTALRGITSSVSILRAVCVPDAATISPCSTASVSGQSLALYLPSPAPSSPCECTLHHTHTNNTGGQVSVYVYEVVSSVAGWSVVVEDGRGRVVKELRGAVTAFPASSLPLPPGSALPLTLTLTLDTLTAPPRRVWLGFRGTESSVTLRCGQDAIDYAMSLTISPNTPSRFSYQP
ncbi:hypothetical protein ACOMHN_013879 [Nucella lapillus]